MRSSRLQLPVLAAILACGPGEPADSATDAATTDPQTAGTTGAPTSSTSSTATSTTQDSTTGPATTGEPLTSTDATSTSTSTSTTDATSTTGPDTTGPDTTGGTTDTTGDASTGEPGAVEFAARYFPGGLDRLVVRKADFGPGLCTSIIFVWPGMPGPGVTLPAMWGVQGAQIGTNIDTCLDLNMPLLANAVDAVDVAGTADWLAPGCPPTLDIDLTLTFPQQQPWTPPMDVLQAMAIPIDGC